ncbi:MAG: hypothetical protein QOC57_1132 [Ilumatobacteraceae bacterium]
MTDPLEDNLDEASRLIAETLATARAELDAVEQRRAQLIALIARTETMQDALRPDRSSSRQMTLHEALAFLIKEGSNRWVAIKDLAAAVNERRLYRKKDGSPVDVNQVHARINNYEYLFEKNGSRVRLRAVP